MVILVTGKAGAGKTHYAREYIRERMGINKTDTAWLDGDKFRRRTGNQDFSEGGRERNLRAAAIKAAKFEEEGLLVICSFVAPLKKWRMMMREYWKESLLVYIPGGALWPGTMYEKPDMEELIIRRNI